MSTSQLSPKKFYSRHRTRWTVFLVIPFVSTVLSISACASKTRNDSSPSSQPAASAKLISAQKNDKALRMAISVRVDGGDKSLNQRIGQQLDRQLRYFEGCLKLSKTEIVRLKLRWTLRPDGTFANVKVLESMPSHPQWISCFTKQISRLQFASEPTEQQGEVEFVTFVGAPEDWSEQKRFEKSSNNK